MAVYHVDTSKISKGKTPGGAGGFAAYLERRDQGHATRALAYLARDGREMEDLVQSDSASLPRWAKSGAHFWQMADRYENGGPLRHGVVARHYQITLPRELSEQGRLDLAEDIRQAFFARYTHTWAVHCPPARDGSGENPHLHVMFSPRRDDVHQEIGPQAWFNAQMTGVHKDRFWDEKRALQGVRHETAVLINAALEREGIEAAVSPDRLRGLGHGRSGAHYHQLSTKEDIVRIQADQAVLRREYHPWENDCALATWDAQKGYEGIRDISREAILDHVRDRFWRHDHSPAREQERAESLDRAIEREYARTGRVREVGREREVAPGPPRRERGRSWEWGRGGEDLAHAGARVHLEHGMEMDR